MYRESGVVSLASTPFRGVLALPYRFDSNRSSFSVTAFSMIAARSPSGTEARMRDRSRLSFPWSSALAVKVTLYRAGASGWTGAAASAGGRGGALGFAIEGDASGVSFLTPDGVAAPGWNAFSSPSLLFLTAKCIVVDERRALVTYRASFWSTTCAAERGSSRSKWISCAGK